MVRGGVRRQQRRRRVQALSQERPDSRHKGAFLHTRLPRIPRRPNGRRPEPGGRPEGPDHGKGHRGDVQHCRQRQGLRERLHARRADDRARHLRRRGRGGFREEHGEHRRHPRRKKRGTGLRRRRDPELVAVQGLPGSPAARRRLRRQQRPGRHRGEQLSAVQA